MKLGQIFTFIFLISTGFSIIKAQNNLQVQDILNLSLEELMNIKINVSSTLPNDILNSPSTVTIINREEIERFNYLDLAQALQSVAGVEILQTNLDRNVPTFRGILQNYYANKILIMINNIPTWQPIYGNGTIDRINIHEVERIEILKGPASVLYGTNAYNGVINIILRNSNKNATNSRITAGYPDLTAASINYNYSENDFKFFIAGNASVENRSPYMTTGANDSIKVDNNYLYGDITEYNYEEKYRNISLSVNSQYKAHHLLVNTYNSSFTYPGINISYATGGNLPFDDSGFLIGYNYINEIISKLNINFNVYYDYFHRDYKAVPDRSMSINLAAEKVGGIIKANYNFSSNLKFELGADIFNGNAIGHTVLDPISNSVIRNNLSNSENIIEWSLFGQINTSFDKFKLLIGSRYTGNKNFGSNVSSRLSALWNINNTNSLKFIIGQAFRTPTMLELYFDHPTVVGNTELHPEKNATIELSYLTQFRNLFLQITGYQIRYKDLIQRIRPDVNKPAEYRNLGEFDGYGFELETKYYNDNFLDILFSYSITNGSGDEAESNYRYVPSHNIWLSLNKNIGKFFISTNSYFYSQTEGHIEEIASQFYLDLHFGFKHKLSNYLGIAHRISFTNLTDSKMLIPEYIRQRESINSLETTGFGRRIIYTLDISI